MGIVVRPHAVVHAPPCQIVGSDGVVEKGRVNLAVEVLTGFLVDGQRRDWTMAAEVLVPLLEDIGQPTNLIFHEDYL